MQRNNSYTFDARVRFSETNHTRHLTLPGIINYFQDCSIFQSEEIGLGIEELRERKRAWVLLSWQIVIERYPRFTEKIRVHTWATRFRGMLGDRNFCMEDEAGKTLAYANSQWMYMDMEKGRPARPDIREIEAYGTGQALEMESAGRKIAVPEGMKEFPVVPVRKYQIDTNEHVNNCQYIQMVLELLTKDRDIKKLRAEYRKAAVYGDVILPRVREEEDNAVAELCDMEGKPYVVAEVQWTDEINR
ncbi:MAG: acyl-[acyl-carrier-protein] thioesterase [Lachnospiraceae bacterium]